ncbi:putative 3-methyladenine-DNA glycosylase I [Chlamydiales bacterium STE3]|nr:putative 3-methyladenine-DNA glycosylase I [Chlamydiales bacterium STE3]
MNQKNRCAWVKSYDALEMAYHDEEWGRAVHDDQKHFEFLILEGAQAGLSWSTILQRRENYRKAFSDFDPVKVANYSPEKMEALILDKGIIRNRLKIVSAIQNARHFLTIQNAFGSFDAYVWRFVDGKPLQNRWKSIKEVPASTKEAQALSADLKKRGFKFVGPTIMYAYMQAIGMVNDHTQDCFCHAQLSD